MGELDRACNAIPMFALLNKVRAQEVSTLALFPAVSAVWGSANCETPHAEYWWHLYLTDMSNGADVKRNLNAQFFITPCGCMKEHGRGDEYFTVMKHRRNKR